MPTERVALGLQRRGRVRFRASFFDRRERAEPSSGGSLAERTGVQGNEGVKRVAKLQRYGSLKEF